MSTTRIRRRPFPVQVRAQVGASRAKLVTSRIDFGLVRLNGTGERPLVIRNASNTCSTPWSVRELTPAVIAQVGGVGDAGRGRIRVL